MGYRDYSTAKGHIVDAAGFGDFTTISAAITAATTGSTIFVRPGTYTENLAIPNKNLNIVAYAANGLSYDGAGNGVVIAGKITISNGTNVNFSGLQFTTNGDYIFSETSTNNAVLYFTECFFGSSAHTLFNYSGSGGIRFYMWECNWFINNSAIAYFTFSGSGASSMQIYNCNMLDDGGSTVPSNFSTTGGGLLFQGCTIETAMTIGGNVAAGINNCTIDPSASNGLTTFVLSGTANLTIDNCNIQSANHATVSAGAGTTATITTCTVSSSAANAFTGAGTVNYSGITFTSTSTTNASTENYYPLTVKQGGTGDSSFGAYAPVCGGATTTSALQSASTGIATAGFVLTSNGNAALPSFQAVSASGAISSITGNSGGAEVPSSGNFNILGSGSITVAGSANTETVQLTGLTNHNVLIGAGTATITNVAPSATSGVPLISQGAAADPVFGTAVVAGGGTGVTTLTGLALGSGTSAFTGVTYVASTTFTPVLKFGGATTGITYTTQFGNYQQVGNCVTFTIYLLLSSNGSAVGNATITGLPVTSANNGCIYEFFMAFKGPVASSAKYFAGQLQPSSTTLNLAFFDPVAPSDGNVTEGFFNATSSLYIQGSYFV